jgi:threonine synthase
MDKSLLYYSTNLKAEPVNFSHALLNGIAPDGGLYLQEQIPTITQEEIANFADMPYHEIAFTIVKKFLYGQIPDIDLANICKDAYDYPVPLENIVDRKYIMRLDQGPTASFKDFAARLMGRLMQYYLDKEHRNLLIITATSGDTGSAIANAFYGLDNIKVVILFPQDEVTLRQRKQMTTLSKNIRTVSVDGKFDDCQAFAKQAFADPDLDSLNLSSANSINIGRLIPQAVYYFYAYARLAKLGEDIIFSVPSGNFGDMMGGIIASKMGLPIKKFVVATNENDEFPNYLKSGIYEIISPSKNCLSSAMNVGHPSNMARLLAIYKGIMDEKGVIHKQPDINLMRKEIFSTSITDSGTKEMIKKVYENHKVLLEPHGAVGWAGLEEFLAENTESDRKDQLCVSLETAHPAKFPEQIQHLLGFDPELSPSLLGLEEKEEKFDTMNLDYNSLKNLLLENYS